MDFNAFYKELKKKSLKGILIFEGQEKYLIEYATTAIITEYLNESFRDFNLSVFTKDNGFDDKIIESLETLPFMDERKVVIIRQADSIDFSDRNLEKLIKLGSSEGIIVVLQYEKKNSKSYRKLKKHAAVATFDKINKVELRKWIVKRLKARGKVIDSRTLERLIDLSNYLGYRSKVNLYSLENEIEKLCNLPGEVISYEMLIGAMTVPFEENVFEITENLIRQDIGRVFEVLGDLYDSGHSGHEIFPLITRNYYNLLVACSLSDRGYHMDAIKDAVGIDSQYAMRKILDNSRKFSKVDLMDKLGVCLEYERIYKSQSVDIRGHLENLIVELIK